MDKDKEIERLKGLIDDLASAINWDDYFKYTTPTEEFVREFKEYIGDKETNDYCWDCISDHSWSVEFLKEFKDSLNWQCLSIFQVVTMEILEMFEDKWDWDELALNNDSFTKEMFEKFKNKFEDNWESYRGK
jgi:hypothetical protein